MRRATVRRPRVLRPHRNLKLRDWDSDDGELVDVGSVLERIRAHTAAARTDAAEAVRIIRGESPLQLVDDPREVIDPLREVVDGVLDLPDSPVDIAAARDSRAARVTSSGLSMAPRGTGAHESPPSVGRPAVGAADVDGAVALDTPSADGPTVGGATHGSGVLLPPDLWVGPVRMLARYVVDEDFALVCKDCGDVVCEIDRGHTLDVLASCALAHGCWSAS